MGLDDDTDLLRIAKCGRVVGLKGEIALWPISNFEQRYEIGSCLIVEDDKALEIEKIRTKKDHYIVKFLGFDTREDIEDLVNKILYAKKLDSSVLEDGEFFVDECLDADVIDSCGIFRGKVQKYIENASSDLLELDSGALVPFKFISRIEDDTIYLKEPEGLFDIEEKDYS